MLSAQGIGKSFDAPGGTLEILSNIDFSLQPGEAAAIVGPSGTGKSTLLYILGALESPSRGTVSLDGEAYGSMTEQSQALFRNRKIGFVFQDHALLPQCTALENVIVPTLVGSAQSGAAQRAEALLKQAGLGERIHHRPGELSGGEKQRVGIARALIREPRLVLCDEPTGNLDAASASTIGDLLLKINEERGVSLVVVTHSSELAGRFPLRYRLAEKGLQRI